jgi:hypothetical protein
VFNSAIVVLTSVVRCFHVITLANILPSQLNEEQQEALGNFEKDGED